MTDILHFLRYVYIIPDCILFVKIQTEPIIL